MSYRGWKDQRQKFRDCFVMHKHTTTWKQTELTLRRNSRFSLFSLQACPSGISGDGCSNLRALRVLLELSRPFPAAVAGHAESLLLLAVGDVRRSDLDRLRALVSLKDFLWWMVDGLGLTSALELRAFPLRVDLILLSRRPRSGTLLACASGSGKRTSKSGTFSSCSEPFSQGSVLVRAMSVLWQADAGLWAKAEGGNP
jgi:hypothetical protein